MSDLEPLDIIDKSAFAIAVFVGFYLIAICAIFVEYPIWVQAPIVIAGWSVAYVSSVAVLDRNNLR